MVKKRIGILLLLAVALVQAPPALAQLLSPPPTPAVSAAEANPRLETVLQELAQWRLQGLAAERGIELADDAVRVISLKVRELFRG